jgi:hypothetical protein
VRFLHRQRDDAAAIVAQCRPRFRRRARDGGHSNVYTTMGLTRVPENIAPTPAWEPWFVAYWAFWLVFASVAFTLILPAAWISQRIAQRAGTLVPKPRSVRAAAEPRPIKAGRTA